MEEERMRKCVVAAAVCAAGLMSAPAWSQPSPQTRRDFTLYNYSGSRITGFFFKTVNEANWTPLQGEQVGPGESVVVHFPKAGSCLLQVRVETPGMTGEFRRPFDFCRLSGIRIYYDYDTATFLARELE